jgi:7-cyano-7-deazaguanine synthase
VKATVPDELVVLASGGADSSILLVDQATQGRVVWPLYIRFGLAWEDVEEAHLRRFLDAVSGARGIRPLTVFQPPTAARRSSPASRPWRAWHSVISSMW